MTYHSKQNLNTKENDHGGGGEGVSDFNPYDLINYGLFINIIKRNS